jgi:protein-export SecD/SecF family membrane protein
MNKKTASIFLAVVFLLTAAGALFLYPTPWTSGFANSVPWKLGLDVVGGTHLIYKIDTSKIPQGDVSGTLSGLRDVIERRVNLFGVKEPQVAISQASDGYYLLVDLAGVTDIQEAIKQIGETPYLDFREVQGEGDKATYVPTELNGRYVNGAQLTFDQTTGKPQVAIDFNSDGAKLFEDITARNVGKIVGIFLDNAPISEPRVNEKISGGKAVISGAFTVQEAKDLVQRFNAGALPAPIDLVNQQTIGASLGKDSLDKSLVAGIAGTLLVMLFMVLYYRTRGILASVALLVYIILSLVVFKLFVTLTLAGIAGFLLSIGMAVDANILIFERTKEELRKGSQKLAAIKEGFRRAWPSIRDSNISTIITSLILFNFTSSFVKGLALTLLLGVLISMFTAITVTRNLLAVTVRNKS